MKLNLTLLLPKTVNCFVESAWELNTVLFRGQSRTTANYQLTGNERTILNNKRDL